MLDISEEVPFEIPNSWQWCRISSIMRVVMGQSPEGETINDSKGVEFHQGKICFTETIISPSGIYTQKPAKIAEPNSLLLCVRAPVGICNITDRAICIGRGLCALKPYYNADLMLWLFFMSTYKKYFDERATGSTFKAISQDTISQTLIPLPPHSEQIRIVKQVRAIFDYL